MYGGRLLFPKRSLDYALALYDKFLQLTLSRMVQILRLCPCFWHEALHCSPPVLHS